MIIEQIYTGCLAQGAYYITSNGEAAIIDPLREVQPYLDRLEKDGVKLKYIFETHFHADFVSGHIDLAKKTGADIIYGPTTMQTGFDKVVAEDGQIFNVGDVTFEVLHTPGHTMESSCFLLRDEEGTEIGLFTGDTLFIGDVGRPDLAQKVIADLTQEKLAGYLYDSLHNKILPLSDDIIVYPAHGAGSACGKNMSSETTDTLGNQKKTNYALQPMSREEFKKEVLTGLTPPPGYFPQNVLLNIQGYDSIDDVLEQGVQALSPRAFETIAEEKDVVIIDTRDKDAFRQGFVPNSIFIGLDGNFASWVGTMIPDVKQEILFIAEKGTEEEVVTRLARVGFDQALGYLEGGIEAWKAAGKEVDTIESVVVDQLAEVLEAENYVDVRRKSEYDSEHIVDSVNAPLDYINETMVKVKTDKKQYVGCNSGYRSLVFISILQSRGYRNLVDVIGGFKAVKESDKFKISDYVCPTTML